MVVPGKDAMLIHRIFGALADPMRDTAAYESQDYFAYQQDNKRIDGKAESFTELVRLPDVGFYVIAPCFAGYLAVFFIGSASTARMCGGKGAESEGDDVCQVHLGG